MLQFEGGLLPPGSHAVELADIEALFVDAFPGSLTRRAVFEGYARYLGDVQELGVGIRQWIDGSFVEMKTNPRDIDIVTYFDAEATDALSRRSAEAARRLFTSHGEIRERYRCDAYAVPVYERGEDRHAFTQASEAYWSDLFGHTRDDTPKGFLELALRPQPT